jgi:undecaprenyl-diphosphatase
MDMALFHILNHDLASPFLDDAMMFISSKYTWIVVGAVFLIYAIARRSKKLLMIGVQIGITLGLVDFMCYQVMKPVFHRERPCHQLPDKDIHLVPQWCGGDYGFPSNHAANGMAATVIVALAAGPTPALIMLALTLVVGFSRVYVGVHFPGDVLGGFVVGALMALLCHWLFLVAGKLRTRFKGAAT